jgi:hypothetical protein
MACPFFDPVKPRGSASDPRFAMLPLGDSWAGMCLADPQSPAAPDEHSLHRLCNFGYARGRCSRFASADAPDAIRFAVAEAGGAAIRIRWAVERDHRPVAHGALAFSRAGESLGSETVPEPVTRLAGAYVASYRRRKDLEQ